MSAERSRFVKNLNRPNESFTVVWNDLLRASNISGNALKMYLNLLSNADTFEMTTDQFMNRLGIGYSAFRRSRSELHDLGLLNWNIVKHPVGAVDAEGRGIAGQNIRTDYEICAPIFSKVAGQLNVVNPHTDAECEPMYETNIGFESYPGDDKTPDESQCTKANIGFRTLLKEKQVKENQSSSLNLDLLGAVDNSQGVFHDDDDDLDSLPVGDPSIPPPSAGSAAEVDVDIPALDALGQVHPGLSLSKLYRAVPSSFLPVMATIDVVRASTVILSRAKRIPVNPAAYVAAALIAAPSEFVLESLTSSIPADDVSVAGSVTNSPAQRWACSTFGHKTDFGTSRMATCFICGVEVERAAWDCVRDHHQRFTASDSSCRVCKAALPSVSSQPATPVSTTSPWITAGGF